MPTCCLSLLKHHKHRWWFSFSGHQRRWSIQVYSVQKYKLLCEDFQTLRNLKIKAEHEVYKITVSVDDQWSHSPKSYNQSIETRSCHSTQENKSTNSTANGKEHFLVNQNGKEQRTTFKFTIIKANSVEKIKTHRVQQHGDHQALWALQAGCCVHPGNTGSPLSWGQSQQLPGGSRQCLPKFKGRSEKEITTNSHWACHVGATPASTTTSQLSFWWLPTQFRVLKTTWKGDLKKKKKKNSRKVSYTDSIWNRGQDTVTEETDVPAV